MTGGNVQMKIFREPKKLQKWARGRRAVHMEWGDRAWRGSGCARPGRWGRGG